MTFQLNQTKAETKYLTHFSSDLSPIDQVLAKLKAPLRKVAGRSVDKVWQAINQFIDQFHADEYLNSILKLCL